MPMDINICRFTDCNNKPCPPDKSLPAPYDNMCRDCYIEYMEFLKELKKERQSL